MLSPRVTATLSCLLVCLLLPFAAARAGVSLGIDTLRESGFAAVRGKHIGLVTNQTGTDAAGEPDRVILRRALGPDLVALFTPEHGLDGTVLAGQAVGSRHDPLTGLAAFSLFGATRKPTPAMSTKPGPSHRDEGADFLITDNIMPGLDGIGLIRRVRETESRLPILMVSAKPGTRAAALAAGASWFLNKTDILDALPELLRQHTRH